MVKIVDVGALTSYNPVGLHGLVQGQLCPFLMEIMYYLYLQIYSSTLKMEAVCSSPNSKAVPYYTESHLRRQ
jgi:hypothetical protein